MWNSFLLYTPTHTEYFVTSLSFGLSSFYHHDYILVTFSLQQFRSQLQLTPWSSMLWYCKQIPVQLKYLNQPRRPPHASILLKLSYLLTGRSAFRGEKKGNWPFKVQDTGFTLGSTLLEMSSAQREGGKKKVEEVSAALQHGRQLEAI